ncbi:hypothetical protein J4458_06300 [Candidatus Woesearchaeota archaeon]|nr:hypothetical protein [Candidatus Woesearchaeota archaeon]
MINKNKSWNPYFAFLLFLVITMVVLLPYLSLLGTIFHERAHINAAAKYGIKMTYEPDILLHIPHFFQSLKPWASGKSAFATDYDKEKFLSLDVGEKREIVLAGIGSDIVFMMMTTFILFILIGLILFIQNKRGVINISLLSMILLIGLVHQIWSTFLNLTYAQGDLTFLIQSILFK